MLVGGRSAVSASWPRVMTASRGRRATSIPLGPHRRRRRCQQDRRLTRETFFCPTRTSGRNRSRAHHSSNGSTPDPEGRETLTQTLRKRDIFTRLSTAVLFLLLMLQLFSKPKQKLAKNLSSHEFGCYMILLLFLNVPMSSPLLLKPLRVLYARHPRMVERLLIGSALINSDYAPSYKESIYKGIERGLQVGLISMTVCRILQKAGFSTKMYKLLTGETGCLLKQINAMEVSWIVSTSILLLKFITVMSNALNVVNNARNTGAKQLRTSSLIGRSKSFLRLVVLVLTTLFFADAVGLPLKPIWTSLSVLTLAFGLASQEIAGNFLGGLNMIFLKPFEVGDMIKADKANLFGVVTDIGLIHTKVRGRENEIISTPNSTFTNSTLVNYSTRQSRVLRMTFGLSQPSGITELLKITKDIQASLESCKYVEKLNQPPRANLKDISLRCFEVEIFAVVMGSGMTEFALRREHILAEIYRIVKDENNGEFAFDHDDYKSMFGNSV